MEPCTTGDADADPGHVTCLLDGNGRLEHVGGAAERHWGVAPARLVGRRLVDLVHADDAAATGAALRELMRNEAGGEFRNRVLGGDGTAVHMRWAGHRIGREERLLCLGVILAEDSLAHQLKRLKPLFDAHPDALCALRPDGSFVAVNRRAESLSGYARAELLRMRYEPLIDPADMDRVREHFRSALAGLAQHFDTRARDRAGRRLELDVIGLPIRVGGGVAGVWAIVRDITASRVAARALEQRTEMLRSILNSMRAGVMVADRRGRLLEVNPAARRLLGLGPNRSLHQLMHGRLFSGRDSDRPIDPQAMPLQRAIRGERLEDVEYFVRPPTRRGGMELSINGGPLRDRRGRHRGGVIVFRDVTRQKEAERKLSLAASALGNTAEGVFIADRDKRLVSVNRAFIRITGHARGEILGRTLGEVMPEAAQAGAAARMWQAVNEAGYWRGELWSTRKTGGLYPSLVTLNAVRDEPGHGLHYVGIVTDISRYKEYEEKLEYQARHDALTRLPSRELFEQRLRGAIARHEGDGRVVAVVFIDLDNFKVINDTYGHASGDDLLRIVARRLRHHLRDGDLLARCGGDEFVALLDDLEAAEEAGAVAAQLLAALAAPIRCNDLELHVSASLGISCYPHDGRTPDTLLKHADSAMYQAKSQGRDRYAFFSGNTLAAVESRRRMANDLGHALAAGQLRLAYRPRFSLESGRVCGAEALLQWQHPELGLILPHRFTPLAAELGLGQALDEWVLARVRREAAGWHRMGHRIEIALALLEHRREPAIAGATTASAPAQDGLDATWLHVELSTAMLADNRGRHPWFVGGVRALGFALAAAASPRLAYLKVDADAARQPASSWPAAGVRIIATDVATAAQRTALLAAGCREGQGPLFGEPLPADAFLELLQAKGTSA